VKELKILLILGKKGALERKISISTYSLGKELKMPQQTVSRILLKLIKKGVITRVKGIKGYLVGITPKGKKLLRNLEMDLNEVFKPKTTEIRGTVTEGLRDGRYYLGLNEYKKNIENKLGFVPFPGTLNVILNQESIGVKERFQIKPGIEIEGFKKGDRVFGPIKCFECKINGLKGSIILPERSHYGSDIMELISPFELRKKLNLKNGDEVVINVERYEEL